MKVALVYDRVNKWGGAERVLLALKEIFPDAHLYTSVYDPKNAPWAKSFKIKTSFLQRFSFTRNRHELLATLMPLVFESFNFDDYDVVISITSESAKGIFTKPHTRHICICLTPTRYLWSGYDEYFKNKLLRFFTKPLVLYLRHWDKKASRRPDEIIAISSNVRDRIKKYYGLDSKIIYPPLTIGSSGKKKSGNKDKGYFLVVSRLVPYKRVDLAVRAATKLGFPLKVIGVGSELEMLQGIAGPTVEFLGKVNDFKLVEYYQNAKALIFPGIEDFGLVMVEAQSLGKPVIAFGQGGAKEIVISGKTGELFKEQNPESLMEVLKNFNSARYNSKDCIDNTERFSYMRFEEEMLKVLGIQDKVQGKPFTNVQGKYNKD